MSLLDRATSRRSPARPAHVAPASLVALPLSLLLSFGSAGAAPVAATPTPAAVKAQYLSSEGELLDRRGVALQTLRIDMQVRRAPWVALPNISPALTAAVIQAEDQRFYTHHGVDVQAMGKAAWDNLLNNPEHVRGASTISMQVAALLDEQLRPRQGRRDLEQKWDQISAARRLEESWSKNEILEAYLNLLTFHGELQGVGAASQQLFDKAPSGLDRVESALLAGMIRAPNATPKQIARRACALLRESKSSTTCGAIEVTLSVALSHAKMRQPSAPAAQVAQRLLKHPGEKVASTLDAGLQHFAEQSLREQLSALRERNVQDAAVVVLDNRSGEILAYVGNAGNKSVDGVTALRQAGSTLKPFLYELAIEKKLLTASSIIEDSPIDISTPAGLYIPQNYDKDFKGYVSVRTSLASSLNVPAVRTLVLTGLDAFHDRLKDVGLASLTQPADYYGYSLALGSAEVDLLDLTNAYRVLANGGMYSPATLVPGVAPARRILDQRGAYIVSDILSDRAARSVTFGLSNELATPYWAAVKTGTSKDMRDNWCIGYTQQYTVGVWVGNFDGQSMWDVSGVTGAAPVWLDVMDYLNRGAGRDAGRAPSLPAGVVAQQITYQPAVEAPRSEVFLSGTEAGTIELVARARREAKIRYPGNQDIIALDPDIPAPNQRVYFQAQAGNGLMWRLDQAELGDAGQDVAWQPKSGKHRLALVDSQGKELDALAFQVRGTDAR